MPIVPTIHKLKAGRFAMRVIIPVWTLDSGKTGPVLLVVAAQHGNEVQGSEVIRRFVAIASEKLVTGKIYAVPFANPPAVRERRPHVGMGPEQPYEEDNGRNMNRAWRDGEPTNDTERLAQALNEVYGKEATHAIDLHCWQKNMAGGILVKGTNELRGLASWIGQRFVHVRPVPPTTLAGHFLETGRVGITLEMAGQYSLVESEIVGALVAAVNMSRVIGLFEGEPEPASNPVLFSDRVRILNINAPRAGLFTATGAELYDKIGKGDLIGTILSEDDLRTYEVRSPVEGYVQCMGASRPYCDVAITGHHPFVSKGDRLATVWVDTKGRRS